MKKLSILFAALLVSVSSLFAAETVYKTISFAADNATRGEAIGSYSKAWTSTTDGFTVDIVNFNNNSWKNWTYIRCGSKNNASVATITTSAAINKAVTKVVVTLDNVAVANLNSTTLTVASDNKFTENVQTITVTAAQGALPYLVTTPAENMYYKLTYDCKKGSANGFVQISKIEYYTQEGADVPATAVALDKTTLEMEQYKSAQLVATLTPADATTEVTWESSNTNVATVSAAGLVNMLVAEGTATIKATAGTVSATCEVTAKAATVLTCAEVVEMAKDLANNEVLANGKYVVRGYVTKLVGTPATDMETYGNYSVWLSDTKEGDGVFEAYQVAPLDGKTIAAVGDYVEVVGNITKCNTTIETVGRGAATIAVIAAPVDPQPAVSPYCQTEVGHFFAENAAPDSYVLLSIGSKNGKTIVRIDQDAAKNSVMFDYLQVTALATAGADVAEGGAKAMAVEFDTPAADAEGNITFEILWSTVGWDGRWMVQGVKVPAAAECEHAVLVGPSTALDAAAVATKAQKRIVNGVLVIEKDGVLYNAQGAKL